jgi:hypothetical protein
LTIILCMIQKVITSAIEIDGPQTKILFRCFLYFFKGNLHFVHNDTLNGQSHVKKNVRLRMVEWVETKVRLQFLNV